MSVYGGTVFSEQTMRRPLRLFQPTNPTPDPFIADTPPQPSTPHYYTPEPTQAVLQRHHVNPIPLSSAQAYAVKAGPRRAVLGVAVLDADDITAEERADAATYFEAVGPDGAAWMEDYCPSHRPDGEKEKGKASLLIKSQAAEETSVSVKCRSPSASCPRNVNDAEAPATPTDAPELPAFASCGAAKVSRRRTRQSRQTSDIFSASSRQNTAVAVPKGASSAHGGAEKASPLSPLKASSSTHARARRVQHKRDEATIVFSDTCVAALPLSVVTAFTDAFQPEQRGVTVRAVLPSRGFGVTGDAQLRTGLNSLRASPANVVDSIAAHALAVVNTAHCATQRVLDRAVVLGTDGADTHVQQCAREAKASQRPRFRRRNSLEVYGRSCYTVEA